MLIAPLDNPTWLSVLLSRRIWRAITNRWISLGTFADCHQSRVAIHALHLELETVAVAAVNLDSVTAHALTDFGRE